MLLFFKKILNVLIVPIKTILWPILYSYRYVIYKKSIRFIYNKSIKKIENFALNSDSKIDDLLLEKYNKRHARKVLTLIDSMPESNEKIIKDINKKSKLDFSYSNKKIGMTVGMIKSEYDPKTKNVTFGINLNV